MYGVCTCGTNRRVNVTVRERSGMVRGIFDIIGGIALRYHPADRSEGDLEYGFPSLSYSSIRATQINVIRDCSMVYDISACRALF